MHSNTGCLACKLLCKPHICLQYCSEAVVLRVNEVNRQHAAAPITACVPEVCGNPSSPSRAPVAPTINDNHFWRKSQQDLKHQRNHKPCRISVHTLPLHSTIGATGRCRWPEGA